MVYTLPFSFLSFNVCFHTPSVCFSFWLPLSHLPEAASWGARTREGSRLRNRALLLGKGAECHHCSSSPSGNDGTDFLGFLGRFWRGTAFWFFPCVHCTWAGRLGALSALILGLPPTLWPFSEAHLQFCSLYQILECILRALPCETNTHHFISISLSLKAAVKTFGKHTLPS